MICMPPTTCLIPREGIGSEKVSLKNTFLKAGSTQQRKGVSCVLIVSPELAI